MAARTALIREADLRRMARVVRKEGVEVHASISLDGTVSLVMGPASTAPRTSPNGFDGAL
jgi:hypothetical protein